MICALLNKVDIMAEQFDSLSQDFVDWIHAQHVYFVATAAKDGRVNVSPKGQDSLRVTGPNQICWMNLTGSGNETAAHLLDTNRITLMWCAFEGLPRILRVYGRAQTIHERDPQWQACTQYIPPTAGTRQYYLIDIDLVQTSCGYAVPFMDFQEDRQVLNQWAEKRGKESVRQYWQDKNQFSIDGLPTQVIE